MDRADAEHRDHVLRAYLAGRNWDKTRELQLVRELVSHSAELLPEFPLLVEHEWELCPGHSAGGKGDLVFYDGQRAFAVVEVKVVANAAGTASNRRRRVECQGRKYAAGLESRFPSSTVLALVYTDDGANPGLRPADERRPGRVLGSEGPLPSIQ